MAWWGIGLIYGIVHSAKPWRKRHMLQSIYTGWVDNQGRTIPFWQTEHLQKLYCDERREATASTDGQKQADRMALMAISVHHRAIHWIEEQREALSSRNTATTIHILHTGQRDRKYPSNRIAGDCDRWTLVFDLSITNRISRFNGDTQPVFLIGKSDS